MNDGYLLRIYDKDKETDKWIYVDWKGSYVNIDEARFQAKKYFNLYKDNGKLVI